MNDDEMVYIRRQWNSWRTAAVKRSSISGLHMDCVSGGVNATAPQNFLHGYVWCDAIVSGELDHSCRHGPAPHHIKICIVQKDNVTDVYREMRLKAEPTWDPKKRRKSSETPALMLSK